MHIVHRLVKFGFGRRVGGAGGGDGVEDGKIFIGSHQEGRDQEARLRRSGRVQRRDSGCIGHQPQGKAGGCSE